MCESSKESWSVPEAQPLKSLEAVYEWREEDSVVTVGTIPLTLTQSSKRRQTLVCHDMAGGYLHDRFVQGCDAGDAYKFYNWQYVDSFVYFSHHFITIPPPGWINAAHKNGVKMLGTMITEWDEGLQRCKDLLASEDAYMKLAEKLTKIALHYGFDGWLVNIENVIAEEKVPFLVDFVRQLTKSMHTAVPHSQVIWYDSVISTGKLKWQDELNEKNSLFFDACDGIFLNYGWKDESLERTHAWLDEVKRPYDAYVGVDVFGRGCRGGGGFNTVEAVKAAYDKDLSVAIFAQGWVYEKLENKQEFTERENKFWDLIHHLCPTHCSVSLPFSTTFCHGQGNQYFYDGKVLHNGPWSNFSLQSLQPTYTQSQFKDIATAENRIQNISIYKDEAYIGGNCIKVSGTLDKIDQNLSFRLFDAECMLPAKMYVSYVYKVLGKDIFDIQVDLSVKSQNESKLISLGKEGATSGCVKSISTDQVSALLKNYEHHPEENGWHSRHYLVNVGENSSVCAINVKITNDNQSNAPAQVLIGNIKIIDSESLNDLPLVTDLRVAKSTFFQTDIGNETKNQMNAMLSWAFPMNTAHYFSIFYQLADEAESSDYKLLGHTHSTQFLVTNLYIPIESTGIMFRVQPVLHSGLRPMKSKLPVVKIKVETT